MRGNRREILLCRDSEEVSQRAAELFVRLADEAVSYSGRFAVALSGGSTPRLLYALLAANEFRQQVPWSRIHLFWGDERCVAPDHPESNYRMAREVLLDKAPIPAQNIHRMPAELDDYTRASVAYEQTLREFFELAAEELPIFDLILLGMGEDGHTASLSGDDCACGDRAAGRLQLRRKTRHVSSHADRACDQSCGERGVFGLGKVQGIDVEKGARGRTPASASSIPAHSPGGRQARVHRRP